MAPITHADEVALTQRLDDLGRRIDAAQARAAAAPASAPPPVAPAPARVDDGGSGSRVWILLVIVLLGVIAGVAGVGALVGGDDDEPQRTATEEQAESPVAAAPAEPAAQEPVADPPPVVAEEPTPAPPSDPEVVDDVPARAPPGIVTVVEGDSFWAIAEREVADDLGRAPTDAEITTYWAQLLDANADRLAEPGNPNLILPGQQLVLVG